MHPDDGQQDDQANAGTTTVWVAVGETDNRTLAEFAINGLRSYEVPAVLDSRPGVLGTAGLPMRSIRDGHLVTFRIMVPEEFAAEAAELVKVFLGGGEPSAEELSDDEEEGD